MGKPMSDSLMSRNDALELVDVSRNTIERMVKTRRFPKPVPISLNHRGWFRPEIDSWMESLRNDEIDETEASNG
jgi:predicted DNA-binding transcriptional regulator AlpA